MLSHSFPFLCTLIPYLTNVKTNNFVSFFYFSANLIDDSVAGEQLCRKRKDTTKFSDEYNAQKSVQHRRHNHPVGPPVHYWGKVDHLRPAWTGPLLPLKFLTLATLMPGCPDKYKHQVRDPSMKTRRHKHKTEAKSATQRRSHPKPLSWWRQVQ